VKVIFIIMPTSSISFDAAARDSRRLKEALRMNPEI